ncbi:hypothetical protein, variant [Capsaspora owczarzaki ATCC 30864]|uniref:Uncharacterized protein n=1 Tax=Capsaspora owczarzaki (strain ATCC 30864) TaxID=595528 RepID=A0A0D2WPD4_CAPO3|nr:hypothetical protein, variant [Capsaspora owczarzaki ATCC 30864]
MPNSFETVELSAAATQEQVLAQVTEVMQELRDATASSPLLGLGAPVAEQSETLIEAHRTRFGQDVLDLTGNPALPELLDELSRLDACFPATHDADEALNLHEQDLINQIAETEAELQRRAWLVLPDLKTTGSAHVEEEDEGMLHDDDASPITQADPSHHPENSSGELKSEASQASMPREVSLAVLAATAAQIQLNRHLTENLVVRFTCLLCCFFESAARNGDRTLRTFSLLIVSP